MNEQSTYYYVNHWRLDKLSGAIIHKESGEQKRLGEYQLKLLMVLAQHAGQVISREQLSQWVWEGRVIGNNSLPNAVHALRLALEDDGKNQRIIKTIPKRGYLLEQAFCHTSSVTQDETNLSETALLNSTSAPLIDTALDYSNDSAVKSPFLRNLYHQILTQKRVFIPVLLMIVPLLYFVYNHFQSIAKKESLSYPFSIKPAKIYSPRMTLHEVIAENSANYSAAIHPDLNQLLVDTLPRIDKALLEHNSHLTIYYHITNATLNYAMTLNNRCARTQLAMNINHWRSDLNDLNQLIEQETLRKIDELAQCNL